VFRAAIWTLRQRRYAALAALMVVVAALCVVAGTWQISRYAQKVRENDALRANAHASAVALTRHLLPLVGQGPAPDREEVTFRTVTTAGSYLPGHQQYVRGVQVNSQDGYYVLDPLRTPDGVLLVVRGFRSGTAVPQVSAPPGGTVHLRARLHPADSERRGSAVSGSVVDGIDPVRQASRFTGPVFNGYATLAKATGTPGLTAIPSPDLSNPAGGAREWQHLAYVVQWHLFALLALAAPFAVARSEIREARRRFLGYDEGEDQFDELPRWDVPEARRLEAGASTGAPAGALALRDDAELARRDAASQQRWEHAALLADRYGRSLGPQRPTAPLPPEVLRRGPVRRAFRPVIDSGSEAHRPGDAYQGSYNDYLWALAMADGQLPELAGAESESPAPGDDGADERAVPNETRIIDAAPSDRAARDEAQD
jgi:cytochrome oxidase assembly protein ShyY1